MSLRPIVYQYREGKVKRTPVRGVKWNLKLCAYKQWKPGEAESNLGLRVTACLLLNESATY